MIKIEKPLRGPDRLYDDDGAVRDPHTEEYQERPEVFDSGEATFDFKSSVYGAKDVKQALSRAQSHKCAFCESKISHVQYGDVEHFRPKGGYRQKKEDELQRPGYFWLAYDWTNLFLACQLCNQRHKRNLFPLITPNHRAQENQNDTSGEDPLFLHPSEDDPGTHIGFREEVAFPVSDSRRGRATIDSLGLNRSQLYEVRRDVYDNVFGTVNTILRTLKTSEGSAEERSILLDLAQEDLRKKEQRFAGSKVQYASMLMSGVVQFRERLSGFIT